MSLVLGSCAQRSASRADRSAVYVPAAAAPDVIPTGTTIAVRTNERIEATQPAAGRTYEAQVTRPIIGSDNVTLVPEGSIARLKVVRVEEPGTVTSGELSLAIESLQIGGRTYPVESMPVEVSGREGLGANRRTAQMVGGGALLGTVIGAIAGGGSGAAIGAAVGAAGGAAAQVITKGNEVKVPAETVLTFQTDQPLRLRGYRR
jgi:hypothetical protein